LVQEKLRGEGLVQEESDVAGENGDGYLGPCRDFRGFEVWVAGNLSGRKKGKGVILRGSVAAEHLFKQVVACFSLGVTWWSACYQGKKKIHSGVIVGGFGDKAFCKFPGHFHALGLVEQSE